MPLASAPSVVAVPSSELDNLTLFWASVRHWNYAKPVTPPVLPISSMLTLRRGPIFIAETFILLQWHSGRRNTLSSRCFKLVLNSGESVWQRTGPSDAGTVMIICSLQDREIAARCAVVSSVSAVRGTTLPWCPACLIMCIPRTLRSPKPKLKLVLQKSLLPLGAASAKASL